MKHSFRFITLAVALSASLPLLGTTFRVPTDRQLVSRADAIVVGTATAGQSSVDPARGIVTTWNIKVSETIKGSFTPGSTLPVVVAGGIVNHKGVFVASAPFFTKGERVLLFLRRNPAGQWMTWGGQLGKFSQVPAEGGSQIFVRGAGSSGIEGIDENGAAHREMSRPADAFLDYVRRAAAGNAVADDAITAPLVPAGLSMPGGGADGYLFATDGSSLRWYAFGPAAPGCAAPAGVENLFPSGNGSFPSTSQVTAAQHAAAAWTNDSASTVDLSIGNSSTLVYDPSVNGAGSAPGDGQNEIFFNIPFAMLPSGPDGQIGDTIVRFDDEATSCHMHNFNGEAFITILEADVLVSESGSQPFEDEVVTHELGHFLGFRHSDKNNAGGACTAPLPCSNAPNSAIMYSSIASNGGLGSNLQSWDHDAVETAYGSGPCRPVITTQPANVSIQSGQTTELHVDTTPAGNSFQWFLGFSGDTTNPIPAAGKDSYITPALTATTRYWVQITDSCGSTNSNTVTVTVQQPCQPITITQQPQSQTIVSGATATLSVTATGTTPHYQWYLGTEPDTSMPVATGSTYTTPALTSTTSYWVQVTNACDTKSSQTATITVSSTCVPPAITGQPASAAANPNDTPTLSVTATGTDLTYQWYQGSASDTSTPVGTNSSSFTTAPLTATTSFWVRVMNSCGSVDSSTATLTITGACVPPAITTQPASGSVASGEAATLTVVASGTDPLSYQWYQGIAPDTSNPVGTSSPSFTTAPLSGSANFWVGVSNSCGNVASGTASITIACTTPPAPTALAVSAIASGTIYSVSWNPVGGSSTFTIDESRTPDFSAIATSQTLSGTSATFSHSVPSAPAIAYYYRVRAIADCNGSVSLNSAPVRVIVNPAPALQDASPVGVDSTVPFGSNGTATYLLHFGESKSQLKSGEPKTDTAPTATYTVSTSAPFIIVNPASGPLPPTGANVTVTVPTNGLPVGSSTGTVNVTSSTGSTIATVPVSVTLIQPVTPAGVTSPAPNAMIVPAIAHLDTPQTEFVSDVRITNTSQQTITYQLNYSLTGSNSTLGGKQTSLDVAPGQTIALNDLVSQWFGDGIIDSGTYGALEIRPLNFMTSKTLQPQTAPFATVVSSRTYANTPNGTYGQFIEGIPFSNFVDKTKTLSLQQVSESTGFRTNLGLVEGSGQAAAVQISIFDTNGQLLDRSQLTPPLLPGEFRQINRYIASRGLPPQTDARIEVKVTSDTGMITAYASVLDNITEDPFLVTPVVAADVSTNKYIVPGVADIKIPGYDWRTDIRLFNGGSTGVNANVIYYPQDSPTSPISKPVVINAGDVVILNDILNTTFGITNSQGAVQIVTSANSSLVATARTYDVTANGTYGQFIPGETVADAVGVGDRPIQLLQLEQSVRYRTNLGLTEVTGNSADVEITAIVPGASNAPVAQIHLSPNQAIQLGKILEQMVGGDNTYNARITVTVVNGTGKVVSYASVVDNSTLDPTYVPGQ